MSKLLVDLLQVREREFRDYIEKLEVACLRPGIDIKLSAEIITKTREKIRHLDLDHKDTTAKELYFALLSRVERDDKLLVKYLDIKSISPDKVVKKLAQVANKLNKKEKSLSMTSAGIKRILTSVPPRKTLRILKYRSLPSVLKREDPRILYAIATIIEGDSWKSQIHARMKRLDVKDIAWQQIDCLPVPEKWHDKLKDNLNVQGMHLINSESGVICLLPVVKTLTPGTSILSLGLLFQAIQKLAIESLPYRRQAFSYGYEYALPEIAHGVRPTLRTIHGLLPTWRAIHELTSKGYLKKQLFESDFVLDDLQWQSVEMKLASLVPEIDFWVDTHYLAFRGDGQSTSFHLIDIASSLLTKKDFEKQSVNHFEGSLWNELQIRYLSQDVITHSLIHQLTQVNNPSSGILN